MTLPMNFKIRNFFAAGVLLSLALAPVSVQAQTISNATPGEPGKLDEKRALALSQAAIGREIGDYSFRDTHGKHIKLSDFKGRPLVISLIYSGCADVCPIITKTLEDVDGVARDALGDDAYNIVTIGFDVADDNPVRMLSFARKNGVPLSEHWKFLSGDLLSVHALSDDLGFQFFESAKGFDHLTQTTIIDADGKVYRQIYGETFDTPHFVDPLKNLVFNTTTPFASVDDLVNKVRLFCTIYDPTTDQYRFEYAIFFRLFAGGTVILGMMVFIGRWLWQNRRSAKKVAHPIKT
ncbi:MAG TPA: SCO family protein [Magnetovibrio sp.]